MLNCIGRVVYAFRRNFSDNYWKKAATKYIGPEMIPIRCNPSSEMICTWILTAKSQLNNIKAGPMYNEYFKDYSWSTYAAYALIKENIQFVSSKSTGRTVLWHSSYGFSDFLGTVIIFTLPLKVSAADLNNAVQGDHKARLK